MGMRKIELVGDAKGENHVIKVLVQSGLGNVPEFSAMIIDY